MKRILNTDTKKRVGESVKVAGWINTIRAHGKIIFIDLRDRTGILQLVFTPKQDFYHLAKKLGTEWVIEVEGVVRERPREMINKNIDTGTVEIEVGALKILSEAEPLPFSIDTDGYNISEKIRLKYRYLDLRRERMKQNLFLRQRVIGIMREFFQKRGFIEIETPILTKSTPEGARDFIVPSRLQPGSFYALPQSPQQYKQLMMVAGFERYFQIARCFRDEDPRADRAYGEFTQLDVEMSFTNQAEILDITEELYIKIAKEVFGNKKITKIPFPRISNKEAMERYGTDKPDLRKDKNNKDELAFCFITDWPLFEKTKEKEIASAHHPFTAPKDEDIPLLDSNPMEVHSWQHDFVLNGFEIGGGSIRITNPEVQRKVFEILGHSKKEIEQKFGHLLEAFKYGVPPHGGIAPGIDRFLMAVLGEPSIREVMAFPAISSGKTSVMDAPSSVTEEQLKELHLKIIKKK